MMWQCLCKREYFRTDKDLEEAGSNVKWSANILLKNEEESMSFKDLSISGCLEQGTFTVKVSNGTVMGQLIIHLLVGPGFLKYLQFLYSLVNVS